MAIDYPDIIFLDGVPSKKLGGISQTLYNLFDSYPQAKLFALVDDYQINEIEENSLKCKTVRINVSVLPQLNKKYIHKLNPLIDKFNAIWRELFGIRLKSAMLPSNALLLVCTTDITKLHVAKLIHQKMGYPMMSYFMDDWTADLNFNWWIDDINKLVKFILDKALGRLMISEQLNVELNKRYSLLPKPTYIVHNPVKMPRGFVAPQNIEKVEIVKIVYAGSIWDMHLDALILVVDSIEILNQLPGKRYELIIYSKNEFWERNKKRLDKAGVTFGGFVLYDLLDEKLAQANLLLVTASFKEQFAAFSRSSVQTKLTDYMKMSIPILSVGPEYGACNQFVSEWNCGYIWDIFNAPRLAEYLTEVTRDNVKYQKYAQNEFRAVETKFNKLVVQNELMEFITSLQQ